MTVEVDLLESFLYLFGVFCLDFAFRGDDCVQRQGSGVVSIGVDDGLRHGCLVDAGVGRVDGQFMVFGFEVFDFDVGSDHPCVCIVFGGAVLHSLADELTCLRSLSVDADEFFGFVYDFGLRECRQAC